MSAPNRLLLASGLTEVALGALTGWPFALTISDPDRARRLGIRSPARMRQWHLDLIMLGGLSALAATAVPELPRRVAIPLAVGSWTNANAFGVLVVRPDWRDSPVYRAGAVASFAATTAGFVGLAAVAVRRVVRSG
jgi:hypothetical protein